MTKTQFTKRLKVIQAAMEQASGDLADLRGETEEWFGEHSENWQEGDNGVLWQGAIDILDEVGGSLEELVGNLNNVELP